MKEALATATLRYHVHLKREQESVRTANFAKMAESRACGAGHDMLLSGGSSDLHPLQQRAAGHLLQIAHAVHIVLP